MRKTALLIIVLLAGQVFGQADTLRIATYNLLQFQNQNSLERGQFMQAIVNAIDPDVIVCQEVGSSFYADYFREQILDPEIYSLAEFVDGPDSDNLMCFKTEKFECLDVIPVGTPLRNIGVYVLRYLGEEDVPLLYVCSAHLQGSTGGQNEQSRLAEVNEYLDFINEQEHTEDHVLLCGDLNVYTSEEPAYQALLANDLFYDPINTPGDWHDNQEFAAIHTQSPRSVQFGGGAHGGLDDRFDHIMATQTFADREVWSILEGSYTSFGNDGRHLNQSIFEDGNDAVSEEMANALHEASDHLPVYMDIICRRPEVGFSFAISMRAGWNMVSSPSPPPEANMIDVWDAITERDNLEMVKDFLGRFYSPEHNFNNITDWNVLFGYQAKVLEADSLIIFNDPIDPQTAVPLSAGWSMAAYLPEEQVNAQDAFANIDEGILLLVKDDLGRFYVPEHDFSNMGLLRRGKGYQIKTTEATEFVWNVPENNQINNYAGLAAEVSALRYFAAPRPSGCNMSLLISGSFENRTEIGVFTGSDLCVGASALQETGQCGIAVWGDDPTTEVIEGALEGESLFLKIQDGLTGFPLDISKRIGYLEYQTDDFTLLSLKNLQTPSDLTLLEPYPNPFNRTVRLGFFLPEYDNVNLTLCDLSGRVVKQIVNENRDVGFHSFNVESTGIPTGIYFVRLCVNGRSATRKIALLK